MGEEPGEGGEVTEPRLLNQKDAAKHLGIGVTLFWSLIKEGAIKPVELKPGGKRFYAVADLDAYVADLKRVDSPRIAKPRPDSNAVSNRMSPQRAAAKGMSPTPARSRAR